MDRKVWIPDRAAGRYRGRRDIRAAACPEWRKSGFTFISHWQGEGVCDSDRYPRKSHPTDERIIHQFLVIPAKAGIQLPVPIDGP